VSDRVNCDHVGFDREQDAPVTGAQPHPDSAFERFHIADAGFRERFNLKSICARVEAVSLRHWRKAAEVNSISFTQ
jgi:hypothetical protein